jgi:hypothetical protein
VPLWRTEIALLRTLRSPDPDCAGGSNEAAREEPTTGFHAFDETAGEFRGRARSLGSGLSVARSIRIAPSSLATALRVASYCGVGISGVWPPAVGVGSHGCHTSARTSAATLGGGTGDGGGRSSG